MERNITFRERESIILRLDDLAKKQGLNRSNFIRMIIREKLARSPPSTSFDTSPEQLLTTRARNT
jgi:metal-responsive CopG/Arc/MetJ family transcriptional regulator